ncbi:transglutaminase family protein, partial [bacterium]|nr:transglutaminase family protein [bacterium]
MLEIPVAQLPPDVLTYLYPSRYCQSDRLSMLAMREFGQMPHGYLRVEAIQAWVRKQVTFKSNSSNSTTSALDT